MQDLARLSELSARSILGVLSSWDALKRDALDAHQRPKAHALGWMQTRDYLRVAANSLQQKVVAPLARYGIDPRPYLNGELETIAPPAGAAPNADLGAAA
ncbi:MAG: hypothetical protein RLZZ450_1788 [Pseudomonadota bacterium]|jgi:hypothetical protein